MKKMLMCVLVLATATSAFAKDKKTAEPPKAPDNYDELYQQYLAAARTTDTAPSPGSLWMAGLLGDLRAHTVNDLVTIHVVEAITGQGTADSKLDKQSSASAAVPNLFGAEGKLSAINPANLATASANTSFKGGGNTSRSGSLTADLTARIAEVLPNGNMVVEGVREIEINGDRQIVVLTGIVRPTDITRGNVVSSTAIGQMRIRYFGRGLMKDNLQPGWLVRVLNKVF